MSDEKYLSESALQDLINDGVSLASLDRFTATAKTLAELNAESAKPVPVDMEVLVGLECEFSMKPAFHENSAGYRVLLGVKTEPQKGLPYKTSASDWKYCRPRPDHWYYWRNFTSAEAFHDKMRELETAGFSLSLTQSGKGKAVAFQVLGPAEGRCWPEDADNA